jgi:hypothetical protein
MSVHRARLQVYQYCSGYITATRHFGEINIRPLQLDIAVTRIGAIVIDTVFIGNCFPKLTSLYAK